MNYRLVSSLLWLLQGKRYACQTKRFGGHRPPPQENMKRKFDPAELELMDRPQPVSEELDRDLRNLRELNRFFGSYALIERFLRRWVRPGANLRVLDLATGSGDIPRLIVDFARRVKADVTVDAVDRQLATLEIARGLSAAYPEITFHKGNILEWEGSEPYDVVFCSLVLHHFSSEDAVQVLRQARHLSRRFVLVSDLRRGWLASVGVFLLTALIFRNALTKYDGRLSAARAFSAAELREMAERAGWRNFGRGNFRFGRQAVWLEMV
jgi:2-polyprenyl-3-methyl-5-hydroxy-6-metoxy-1,4-benzoquinol methylase